MLPGEVILFQSTRSGLDVSVKVSVVPNDLTSSDVKGLHLKKCNKENSNE